MSTLKSNEAQDILNLAVPLARRCHPNIDVADPTVVMLDDVADWPRRYVITGLTDGWSNVVVYFTEGTGFNDVKVWRTDFEFDEIRHALRNVEEA